MFIFRNICILKQLVSNILQFFSIRMRLWNDRKTEISPILLKRNITTLYVGISSFFTSM